MTGGLRRILRQNATVLTALVLVVGGAITLPTAPAEAGTVSYVMTCHEPWSGDTDINGGDTIRGKAGNSACTTHYA